MEDYYNKGQDLGQTILGIDIGSTKICAIIATCKDGIPRIIGTGFHKSMGLKKGSITNIEQASRAIKDAVNDARRVAGTNINKSIINIIPNDLINPIEKTPTIKATILTIIIEISI